MSEPAGHVFNSGFAGSQHRDRKKVTERVRRRMVLERFERLLLRSDQDTSDVVAPRLRIAFDIALARPEPELHAVGDRAIIRVEDERFGQLASKWQGSKEIDQFAGNWNL